MKKRSVQPPAPRMERSHWVRGLCTGVLALVLGMSVPVVGSQLLRAQVAAGAGSSSSLGNSDDPRSCTSTGTMFMGITRPVDAVNLFRTRMSEVVAEREELLKKPTMWQCYGGANGIQPPPSPLLQALADELPGWHYKYTTNVGGVGTQTTWVPKPVNFESFASVVMEFEREYECKMAEFQPASPVTVRTDQDLDGPDGMANTAGANFCCTLNSHLCVDDSSLDSGGNPITCDPDLYSGPDPVCQKECSVKSGFGDFSMRVEQNFERVDRERARARFAVERTLLTLRSLETSVIFTVQMSCFQRVGMDLKQELSLLADGTSCMPKIWDSVNALHDLKGESPPEL